MAASASVAVARLGGDTHYWGRVGDDDLATRILGELAAEGVDVSSARRVPGCVSPSAAILVDDAGDRLVCAYNDPALDPDPGRLRHDRVQTFAAVLADVRWPEGAAVVLDAARSAGRLAVFDGDIGPPETLVDLAHRATHALFSVSGLALATGGGDPGAALARFAAGHPVSSVSRSARTDFCGARPGSKRVPRATPSVPWTRSLPGTSGTGRLPWRWRKARPWKPRRVLPMRRRPSNARGSAAAAVRRRARR